MKSELTYVKGAKESIRHKINTNIRMFINRLHSDFPPHWHTDIEVIIPMEAPYKVICSNQKYFVDIGDILLICPAVLHEIFSPVPGARLYIQADFSGIVSLKELEKAFRLMSPALHIKKKNCPKEVYDNLFDYIDRIKKLYFGSAAASSTTEEPFDENVTAFTELDPFEEIEIYSILMEFIAYCAKNIGLFIGSDSVSPVSTFKNSISLSNVCAYISEHFTENISLESVASYAGFSKYHFERIFSDYTGLTFYQYLQQMRINYAQTLLSNPELSITDISYQAGFASSAAFTRAFRKSTGYPPSQFRMLNEVRHPLPANPHFAKLTEATT